MKFFSDLRLGWKLFISYLVLVLVTAFVLIGTAQFRAPEVLSQHIDSMQAVLGYDPALNEDLYRNFDAAINEVWATSLIVALVLAVIVSIFVTRRIVGPIQFLQRASTDIAQGDYHRRVSIPGDDELGMLADSFNQMASELESVEQRRMELIGNVAHELRTPLSSVRGTLEAIEDGVLSAGPETIRDMQAQVSRLQRLVLDLEELSRAEAGQMELEREPVHVETLVKPAVAQLASQFEDNQVRLQLMLTDSSTPVLADSGRITQVLVNLLGNALHYTPAGGNVELRAWKDRELVWISVSDDGIGIDAQHLPHIFERFYRVDKSRSRTGGGSGIGLTISRHIVEAHGGTFRAASAGPNLGSTITFSLPRAADRLSRN